MKNIINKLDNLNAAIGNVQNWLEGYKEDPKYLIELLKSVEELIQLNKDL